MKRFIVVVFLFLPVLAAFADHPIFFAINSGKRQEVAKILKKEKIRDIEPGFMDQTPLQLAVAKADLEIVKLLVDAGADIKPRIRSNGFPLIFSAIKSGRPELVDYLLAKGCSAKDKTPLGNTPLHAAVIGQNTRIVARLLKARADVNARECLKGYTPLHYTLDQTVGMELFNYRKKNNAPDNLYQIATMLLQKGADPRTVGYDGKTPYALARERNKGRIADVLSRKGAAIPAANKFPLQILPLVKAGNHESVKKFLQEQPNGAKTWFERGAFDGNNYAPISVVAYSAHQGNLPMLKLLLAAGGDPSQPASAKYDLQTPLHFAARNGHYQVAEYLLQNGASAKAGDKNETTPLHSAVLDSNLSIIKLLRKFNASPHKANLHGIQPVDWAVSRSPLTYIYLKKWMWQTSDSDPYAAADFQLFAPYELQLLLGSVLAGLWPLLLPLFLFFIGWKLAGSALLTGLLAKLLQPLYARLGRQSPDLSQKETFFVFVPLLVALIMVLIILPLFIVGLLSTGGHPPFIIFPLAINAVCAVFIFPLCILLLLIGLPLLRKQLRFLSLISLAILLLLQTTSLLTLISLK